MSNAKATAAAATPVGEAVATAKQDNTPVAIVNEASFYKTPKAIEAAIEEANASTKLVMLKFQLIACSALVHLAKHHDIRIIRNMLSTFPEGMRKVAMSTFIDKFGTVSFDAEGEVHYNAERKLNLAGAMQTAWWKTVKEAAYRPFNILQELKKILDKGVKRFDVADPEKGDFVPADVLTQISGIVNAIESQQNKLANTEATLDGNAAKAAA